MSTTSEENRAGGDSEPSKDSGLSKILLAVVPIIISLLSAYYTYSQVQVGKAQNQAAAEQQLVSVVTAIAQLNASSGTVASVSTGVENRNEELTYGQAGESLINSLPATDITATDYVQVGKALADGGDYSTALGMFDNVLLNPQDPDAFANAKRNAAILWYEIADNQNLSADIRRTDEANARSDALSATSAYGKSRYIDLFDEVESVALTYLDDAYWQADISCPTALDDMNDASSVLSQDKAVNKNLQISDEKSAANSEIGALCP